MRPGRSAVLVVILALAGALASLGAANRAAVLRDRIPDLDKRLAALAPSRPAEYFELAEEVADAAESDAERALARQLFGLAGTLDTQRLGRSACLALADLAADGHDRRRLLALAWLLDRGGGGSGDRTHDADAHGSEAALAVAEAFSFYRKGYGGRALEALQVSGAMELVEAHDQIFRGGAQRFLADCDLYRGGGKKPAIAPVDLSRMLKVEAALLAGADRSWSAELLLSRGEPLVEVDPDRLAETLGVDPEAALWRNGRWEKVSG